MILAARSQHVTHVIEPALQRGAIVLCDRFSDSTFAYQGFARGLNLAWLRTANAMATNGCSPDLTLLLDIDPETSLDRARVRNRELSSSGGSAETRMDDQAFEFHRRVHDAYASMAREEPARFVVIDGRETVDAVAEAIWQTVQQRLSGKHV